MSWGVGVVKYEQAKHAKEGTRYARRTIRAGLGLLMRLDWSSEDLRREIKKGTGDPCSVDV